MQATRPYVLSIAGFDPSAGAGLLADCKTFEQHGVYGFGVCSALTEQNDVAFLNVNWLSTEQIVAQLLPLLDRFTIAACKIGIIGSPATLYEVVTVLKQYNPFIPIVWDPVLKASTGYELHSADKLQQLQKVLPLIDLLTPNYEEWKKLEEWMGAPLIQQERSVYGAVLLKGGHRPDAMGVDTLFEKKGAINISSGVPNAFPKHGSGCVLSAAITALLAQGHSLATACELAKRYVEAFLNSNESLLGYHG